MRKALKKKLEQRASAAAAEKKCKTEEKAAVTTGSPGWRPVTKVLLVLVGLGLIAYDLLPFLDPARHDTISEVIAEYSLTSVTIPMVFGALMGHFFFLRDGTRPTPVVTLPLLAVLIAVDAASHTLDCPILRHVQAYPAAWFIAGIPVGAIFWPQTKSDKEDVHADEDTGGSD